MKKVIIKNMIPCVNTDPFFINYPEFKDEYIINSSNRIIEPTFNEKRILNEYFLTEIGFGLDKDINFSSSLVSSYLDFARWYLNKN
ncbi:hypothetical protein [Aquirufa aurantiipilula]